MLAKTWFAIFLSAMAAADIHAEVNYKNFEAASYRQLLELAVFITGCWHVCVESNRCQWKKASKENIAHNNISSLHRLHVVYPSLEAPINALNI